MKTHFMKLLTTVVITCMLLCSVSFADEMERHSYYSCVMPSKSDENHALP